MLLLLIYCPPISKGKLPKLLLQIFLHFKNNLVNLGSRDIMNIKLRTFILYFTEELHVLKNK